MSTLAFLILACLILVVLLAPRRWAILGVIAGVLYLTQEARLVLFGINVFAIRFLEIALLTRVYLRGEFTFRDLNGMDKALLMLYGYTTLVFVIREKNPAVSDIAMAMDPLLCYFGFRGLFAELDDLRWFLRSLVFLLLPFVALVALEMVTFRNQFSLVGQTSEQIVREGRVRCIGSFRQPITMGTFGVSFLPLYVGLALDKERRRQALAGIGLCASIVFLSNSGGPLNATAFGLVAWLCWGMRERMYVVRRLTVGLVIVLGLVMKAPIWYLPAKLSDLTGGGGWHRSYLLDMAIKNLGKWWLAGMAIIETKDWMPYTLAVSGGADITNQYLAFGLTAGLGAVALFITLLVRSFKVVGQSLRVAHARFPTTPEDEYLIWGLGATLLAHVSNFFGVCYFDQVYVVWFMLLAIISGLTKIFPPPAEDGGYPALADG
jgi:hypothetical protein